jgi:hypothetical protein
MFYEEIIRKFDNWLNIPEEVNVFNEFFKTEFLGTVGLVAV